MAKKTTASKFAKFNQQEPTKKVRYKVTGSVCTGYKVVDTQDNSVVLESEYMWDALDLQRSLNSPK